MPTRYNGSMRSHESPPAPTSPTAVSTSDEPAADAPPAASAAEPSAYDAYLLRHELRNFIALVVNQVVLRSGWIFKTETVIVPAFLDTLAGGAGWMRGLLPVLNRLGQSVPPLFYASTLSAMPRKKWSLVRSSFVMGVPWLVLALFLNYHGTTPPAWLAPVFLIIYTLFGVSNGINQISYNTVQGKLIRAEHRGRLLALAAIVGAITAIGLTWWFLGDWLDDPAGGFDSIFAFCGIVFVISGISAMFCAEPKDDAPLDQASGIRESLADAWSILRDDKNFRRLIEVVVLFSTILILFPHFQAFARERLGLAGRNLMIWVIAQNAALGVYSLFIGPIADRFGNRLALRVIILTLATTPLLAIVLGHVEPELGRKLYPGVFALLGLTPVMMRTTQNYTLEICRAVDHPRYLGTLGFCLAVPFSMSPLVGWAVDLFGFERVFLGGAAMLVLGGLVTFRLVEPRHAGFVPADTSSGPSA
ncbi:MAG: MFS transporter [Pirellulales bacterium]|nr:MFS transporter [Pirellulales bacterium]